MSTADDVSEEDRGENAVWLGLLPGLFPPDALYEVAYSRNDIAGTSDPRAER